MSLTPQKAKEQLDAAVPDRAHLLAPRALIGIWQAPEL